MSKIAEDIEISICRPAFYAWLHLFFIPRLNMSHLPRSHSYSPSPQDLVFIYSTFPVLSETKLLSIAQTLLHVLRNSVRRASPRTVSIRVWEALVECHIRDAYKNLESEFWILHLQNHSISLL
jgi:hypothetical protein